MAVNQLMHERNPFKAKKPDFAVLAEKHETFRQQSTTDSKGRVHIDFKNPACLKALTWCLLKDEYDVDVEIPLDRLIPTVPLRVNYILWLEDIFREKLSLKGIDVGTGAVCVYPIIGAKKNDWSYLATEADATNFEYANRNVQQNNLVDKIKVIKVGENCSLLDILQDSDENYDFCMCNPPFYGSNLEAWGVTNTRSADRPEPNSVNTASPVECIVPGGEVEFVRELIISSSVILRNRIRVYTSMLGKKSSLSKVKEILRENNITNVGSSEFCQGNTMRWGIGWSFDENVRFPMSASKLIKSEKPRPPLVLNLPSHIGEQTTSYTLPCVADQVMNILKDLKFSLTESTADKESVTSSGDRSWVVTSFVNTWSHQRRERRRRAREHSDGANETVKASESDETEQPAGKRKRPVECGDEPSTKLARCDDNGSVSENDSTETRNEALKLEVQAYDRSDRASIDKNRQTDGKRLQNLSADFLSQAGRDMCTEESDEICRDSAANESLPLLKCTVAVCSTDSGVAIQFQWISGGNREYMHQLMQFVKNKLKSN